MPLLQIVVLAVVQGLTEFLPISSSGHLILVPVVTGWPDQGLTIDVAAHVGTLVAVMLYFRRDLAAVVSGVTRLAAGETDPGARLAGQLIVATIPVMCAGIAVHQLAGDALRSILVIGWATLGFGVLLLVADRIGGTIRRIEDMRWGQALLIGVAQMLALIPGTSRSGITMTAARFIGYDREEAARFSLLLSIPTLAAAGIVATYDLAASGSLVLGTDALLAAVLAFLSGLLAIGGMMRWLRRATFTPFVLYRLLLGAILLLWAYGSA